MIRHAWLFSLLRVLAKDKERFDTDVILQYKIHRYASYFWIVNFFGAIVVFFALPGFWAHASILYLTLCSLYANFATDYGAMSAALAAQKES
jgi:hypothetical protein